MTCPISQVSLNLTGKTALVTGASRGIGAELARALAKAGCKVVINTCHSAQAAGKLKAELDAQGASALVVQADLSRYDDIQKLFDVTESQFGPVDILINNAGLEIRKRSTEYTEDDWECMVNTNLKGSFFAAQRALRTMATRGWGRIVNLSSVHETRPTGNRSIYSITKGGLHMLTRELALEFGPLGITVNSIALGAIRTDMNRAVLADPDYTARVLQHIPSRFIGETSDVSPLVLFLLSEQARYINGATLPLDGGMQLT
ncbi:MAG: glucose 1-dehydrogenase [Planctomycetia bacterium]|nr:glucose 1-dehydrogenase [Planctomycetia bacterium]